MLRNFGPCSEPATLCANNAAGIQRKDSMMGDYDTDVAVWSERQAALLRRTGAGERVNDQVDWENVAEEIDSLGRSDRRELRSRVRTILLHLMKLQASPATEPHPGWRQTILRERIEIRGLFKDSPSLRPTVPAVIAEEIEDARTLAVGDLAEYHKEPRSNPAGITYTVDQVLGPWMPD
jgi:uncharacterized protein DUF29